ncbi:L-2-amino-thiazoline-4-carboxylic acid hydrolase [Azotosporobacter soli]|uniref:L-2-amino-thiazoline-4-carboxylic acid hydrolase n=1 Tax=Azotosporobacter soli TaxID=3055040 RepID=UPI0031FECBEC
MAAMNRREFIKCSAMACLSCSMFLKGFSCVSAAAAQENYYLMHKKDLVGAFRGVLAGVRQMLKPEFGEAETEKIIIQAETSFINWLPGMPEVGGAKNWDVEFIPVAAWYAALYRPLRARGKTAEFVGKMIYQLNEYTWASTPKDEARASGEALFSTQEQENLRQWALWTQERQYPQNWVANYLEGDGNTFDYGIDYTECGVVKYLQAQGTPELAPYVCSNDFIKSRAIGSGLVRSKTIARGDGICNFRYKKDRPVLQDWESELKLMQKQ